MPEYDVSWVNGAITADSPEDAARQCREMLLDPHNLASVFLVEAEDGTETEVDVLALPADNDDSVKLPTAPTSYPESKFYTGGRSSDEYTMAVLAMAHDDSDDDGHGDVEEAERYDAECRRIEAERLQAVERLLADWFEGALARISETGSSRDWSALIEDAKSRHEALGVPWSNTFVPSYVREIMALDEEV